MKMTSREKTKTSDVSARGATTKAPKAQTMIVLLFCLVFFIGPIQALVQRDACELPLLPTTFDSVAFLEFNDEMHINQAFRINTTSTSQAIDFHVAQGLCRAILRRAAQDRR